MPSISGKILDNALSITLSLLVGVAGTVIIFYMTSHPETSSEVQTKLSQNLSNFLFEKKIEAHRQEIEVDGSYIIDVDLDQSKSVLIYGHINENKGSEEKQNTRVVWAIYEPSAKTLIDQIVGRQGFYKLSTYGFSDVSDKKELYFSSINYLSLDRVGNKAVYAELSSEFADRISKTFLIMKRDKDGKWHQDSLPIMSGILKNRVNGKLKLNDFSNVKNPVCCFSIRNSVSKNFSPRKLFDMGISEDEFDVNIDGKDFTYSRLYNGAKFVLRQHNQEGYPQIFVLSIISDDRAVQGKHYVAATMFKIDDYRIVLDDLWNWGYPMISTTPMYRKDIEIDSVIEEGFQAHISNDTFFEYDRFGKYD